LSPPENFPNESGATAVMLELLGQLKGGIQELKASFDEKVKFDVGREAVIDRLHAELQEYKADLVLKILKPVALDLINLHDDVGKILIAHQAEEAETAANLVKLIASFRSDIEDILYRHGFEAFSKGDVEFDPKCQRAFRTVSTGEVAMDRKIVERLRKGFKYEGRVVRPEIVAVYTHKPISPAAVPPGGTQ